MELAENGQIFKLSSDPLRHPVLDVLPSQVVDIIRDVAVRQNLDEGEGPARGDLYFLNSGVLGLFPPGSDVCSGMIVPGSVYGWEALLDNLQMQVARAIVPATGFALNVSALRSELDDRWTYKFLAAHAVSRARVAGIEAACNARHTAAQRTAKWMLRLYTAVRDPDGISITQAKLAELLGFQRTSINAACGYLKDRGAIRIRRGRLFVLDAAALQKISCECDLDQPDGQAERRQQPRFAN